MGSHHSPATYKPILCFQWILWWLVQARRDLDYTLEFLTGEVASVYSNEGYHSKAPYILNVAQIIQQEVNTERPLHTPYNCNTLSLPSIREQGGWSGGVGCAVESRLPPGDRPEERLIELISDNLWNYTLLTVINSGLIALQC